ncbi:DUF5683 domain-containing protein [Methanogenium sp. MK-MG]|uniref:DUF5683 domain-containing protein n=1 Tax=Methanogenium sp. MK-MG TaxID=2599926 RepID=UPI001C209B84|nr:DUF5683 domain-containing protein [Methanogenium sp. MK-MG]
MIKGYQMGETEGMPEKMPVCPECGNALPEGMTGRCPTCREWKESAPLPPQKNVHAAVVLSFFFPGFGQVYNGQYRKGLIVLVATIFGLYFFLVPGLVILCAGVYDTYRTALRQNAGTMPFREMHVYHIVLYVLIFILVCFAAMSVSSVFMIP